MDLSRKSGLLHPHVAVPACATALEAPSSPQPQAIDGVRSAVDQVAVGVVVAVCGFDEPDLVATLPLSIVAWGACKDASAEGWMVHQGKRQRQAGVESELQDGRHKQDCRRTRIGRWHRCQCSQTLLAGGRRRRRRGDSLRGSPQRNRLMGSKVAGTGPGLVRRQPPVWLRSRLQRRPWCQNGRVRRVLGFLTD